MTKVRERKIWKREGEKQGQKRKVADRDPASVMSLKDKVREGSMWLRVLEKKTHSLSKAHKHKHILG